YGATSVSNAAWSPALARSISSESTRTPFHLSTDTAPFVKWARPVPARRGVYHGDSRPAHLEPRDRSASHAHIRVHLPPTFRLRFLPRDNRGLEGLVRRDGRAGRRPRPARGGSRIDR